MKLIDERKLPVQIGREIGRGGEARICELIGTQEVAKIYHLQPLSREKIEKLEVLRAINNSQLQSFTALPTRLLFNDANGGMVGFTMPYIAKKQPIFQLLGPKSRKQKFPDKDYRYLVFVALNTAKAFASIHRAGVIVGDVNESGVLVGQEGRVSLIDCDSFQVQANNKRFLCEVGVPGFTPPELQGRTLRVERTENHDCFGLAVLIFQLLFMGRHPYVGQFTGVGEMPLERAIAEKRFAYSRQQSTKMLPPPNCLRLDEIGPLGDLFERSFLTASRPSAAAWVNALESFTKSLERCKDNASHWFSQASSQCPWCRIEASSGLLLFAFVGMRSSKGTETYSIAALWSAIDSIPSFVVGPFPTLPTNSIPSNVALQAGRRFKKARLQSLLWLIPASLGLLLLNFNSFLGILLFVISVTLFFVRLSQVKHDPIKEALQNELRNTAVLLEELKRRWDSNASVLEFVQEKSRMQVAKDELVHLPAKRTRELDELQRNKRDQQLRAFLDKFDIASADIDGIGKGRMITLRAHNVYTAADVTPYLKVPGFGPTYMGRLKQWRSQIEAKFVFDPQRAVDATLVQKIEHKYCTEMKILINTLQSGPMKLRKIVEEKSYRQEELKRQASLLLNRISQIKADLKVL